MREIKYRNVLKYKNDGHIKLEYTSIDKIEGEDSWQGSTPYKLIERQQFTGLKDKNGKDIYEGDVVKINNLIETWKRGEPEFDWRIFAIEYNHYTWAFNNSVLYMPMSAYHDGRNGFYHYEIEVIGNIYENPELLNKYPPQSSGEKLIN